jgi:hypothetical protein
LKAKKKGINTPITKENYDWEGMGLKLKQKTQDKFNTKVVKLKSAITANELNPYSDPHVAPNVEIVSMSKRKE